MLIVMLRAPRAGEHASVSLRPSRLRTHHPRAYSLPRMTLATGPSQDRQDWLVGVFCLLEATLNIDQLRDVLTELETDLSGPSSAMK